MMNSRSQIEALKYWIKLKPEGYKVDDFDGKRSARFIIHETGESLEVTDEHVKFFKGN
jgi:hypothetical protein